MKRISTSAAALIAATFFAGSAGATDIFDARNDPAPDYAEPAGVYVNHTGFYIGGSLGIANGDRDIRQDIRTQKDCLYEGQENGEAAPFDGSQNTQGHNQNNTFFNSWAEIKNGDHLIANCDDTADEFSFAHVDDIFSPVLGPLIYKDLLGLSNSDSWDAITYGGEVSYLYQIPTSKFGLEPVLGAVFYGDNETVYDIDGSGIIQDVNAFGAGVGYGAVDDLNNHVVHSGESSFERKRDIDLIMRGHYFVNPDLSIYAQGGASWAKAKFSTSHATGYNEGSTAEGVFDNAFSQSDTSLGYVIGGGLQYWVAPNVTFGVDYTYKHHEFEFGSGNSTDAQYSGGGQLYRYGVSDDISVDEDIHAVKAKLSIKLN